MKEKKSFISFWFALEIEGEKQKSKFLSSIYGVPSVEIRRAKNKSSSTRRKLLVGTEIQDFADDSSEKFRKSKVSG